MEDNIQQANKRNHIPTPPELEGKDLGILPKPVAASFSEGVVSSEESPCNLEVLDKYAKHVHSYIREYISFADKKASFVFTIAAAFLVYLYEKGIIALWMKLPNSWTIGDILAFVAVGGLFLSCLYAVSVVYPRLHGSKRGFIFWESIAEFESASQYTETAEKLKSEQIIQELLKHVYELSCICKAKYHRLNWAIRIGAVGAISAILYLLKG